MTKYAEERRKGHSRERLLDRPAAVTKVINFFELHLKKKQPPLPLEKNASNSNGGPNDVRGTSGGGARARRPETRGAACSNESISPASQQHWLIVS